MQTATIRARGQLTIPGDLRESLEWLNEGSVVTLEPEENRVSIKPYRSRLGFVNWKEIWERIQVVRSFKGKRGNLAKFVVEDRQAH